MSRTVDQSEVTEFVARMGRTYAGREMTERVFRSVAGPGAAPVHMLRDDELAFYLLQHEWTFSDVCKRES